MAGKKRRPVTYHFHRENFGIGAFRYDEPREIKMNYLCSSRYFCCRCGEIWATEEVAFSKVYRIINQECDRCKDHFYAGSILLGFAGLDRERWDGAPYDLLVFEFLKLMEKWDRNRAGA